MKTTKIIYSTEDKVTHSQYGQGIITIVSKFIFSLHDILFLLQMDIVDGFYLKK